MQWMELDETNQWAMGVEGDEEIGLRERFRFTPTFCAIRWKIYEIFYVSYSCTNIYVPLLIVEV